MPNEWQRVNVGELLNRGALFIGDGYRAKNVEFGPTGLPFARVGNIGADGELDLSGADLFPEKDLHKVGNKISLTNDIAFTSKGTVGRFIFVKEGTPRFVYSPQVSYWRVINRAEIEPRFLIFWMRSREFIEQVHGLKGQTDMADYVSLNDQRRMTITLPPLPIQRRIAEILGRLDDKIEVNRRINRTLERMAQALYKHWFVDFGPFQEGEFVESEVGLAPRGWEVEALADVVDLLSGGTPRTSVAEYWDGDIDWVSAKDVANSAPFIMATERKITRKGVDNSATKMLPAFTTVITARGTVGECGLLPWSMAMNQTNYGVRGKDGLGDFTTYLIVRDAVDRLRQHAYGTVFDTITRKTFEAIQVVLPPNSMLREFEAIIDPWFQAMLVNQRQNTELARTRDYLLPRLLAGDVEVMD